MILFADTNVLLSALDRITKEDTFCISSVTIEELENIKTDRNRTEELRYSARKAVNWLNENEGKYKVVVYDKEIEKYQPDTLEINNDAKILACAKYEAENNDILFVSNDNLARLIGKTYYGLKIDVFEDNLDIYTGYKLIKGNSDDINQYMNNIDINDWNINEYLVIENTDDESIKEMRFDGDKFVSLKLPPSKYIKGKNSLQRCALDALMNPDITIVAVLGTYGSGKTKLCMSMGLYHIQEKGNQSKMLGVRELRGEGEQCGFLPGEFDNKTEFFFTPLIQQLPGGEFELEHLKQRGILDFQIPYYLKGTTYNETVIICDEAEDLKESQIRLIGTRLGENSQIFFSGDYKQSVLNKTKNNALIEMCNELKGNPKFACICLSDDVRSNESKLFAEMFNK